MDRVALVTGAAGGIGSATARLFVKKGWSVALLDSDENRLADLANELTLLVGREKVFSHAVDATRIQPVQEAVDAIGAWSKGSINCLVNAAGLMEVGDFELTSPERHKQVILVNLWGIENVTLATLPMLKKSDPACIVNLSSITALYGTPDLSTYAATKAAVRSLTESWDLAYRNVGIRVCDLLPTFVDTKMVAANLERFAKNPEKKIRLSPDKLAEHIWKAVHGTKLHYPIGLDTRFFVQLDRFLPARIRRWVVRNVGGYS